MRLGAKQLRQPEAGHAGDAKLEEAAPAEAVAIARRAAEIDSEHEVGPPGRAMGWVAVGGGAIRSADKEDRSPDAGACQQDRLSTSVQIGRHGDAGVLSTLCRQNGRAANDNPTFDRRRANCLAIRSCGSSRNATAGYGSRTRLAALGRLCTADMPIPRSSVILAVAVPRRKTFSIAFPGLIPQEAF